jgi:hypothetical protein
VEALGEASSHGFEKAGSGSFGGTEFIACSAIEERQLQGCWSPSWQGLGELFRKISSPHFLVFELVFQLIQEARWN